MRPMTIGRLITTGRAAALCLGLIVFSMVALSQAAGAARPQMSVMDASDAPRLPTIKGYAEGQEIWFIHTEASDGTVAEILSAMMRSPVLGVPSLADAPKSMLARVYIFRNGVEGYGTLKFQPDVFDHPPGDPAYSPLRSLVVVTWKNERSASVLKSAADVQAALARQKLNIDELGVVVNMPLVSWPGGQR